MGVLEVYDLFKIFLNVVGLRCGQDECLYMVVWQDENLQSRVEIYPWMFWYFPLYLMTNVTGIKRWIQTYITIKDATKRGSLKNVRAELRHYQSRGSLHSLKRWPQCVCSAITHSNVEVTWSGAKWDLRLWRGYPEENNQHS